MDNVAYGNSQNQYIICLHCWDQLNELNRKGFKCLSFNDFENDRILLFSTCDLCGDPLSRSLIRIVNPT